MELEQMKIDSLAQVNTNGDISYKKIKVDPLYDAMMRAKGIANEAAIKFKSDKQIGKIRKELEINNREKNIIALENHFNKEQLRLNRERLLVEKEKQANLDLKIKAEKRLSEQQKLELKSKNRLLIYLTSGFFFFCFFSILIIYFFIQIRKSKNKIEDQRNLLELKNTEILDSIEYAKRIQTAILPPPRIVKSFLKNSFILYLPKDIVAGDFYWMESIDESVYFAACDCTGHGVPGAMVSVVCNNALNRALHEFGERMPGNIFDKTRQLVMENFAKSDEEVHDGMDASLCVLDINTRILRWSGANNPIWIYHASEKRMQEIKPDKQAIGRGYEFAPFTTHEMELEKGDIIYIFTDGYADQFGGVKGKKLTKAKFRENMLHIAELPMETQREKLLAQHDEWRGKLEQVDDICVIGVRV
ncbi:MAG: PP2C family protein-serine/threonine phosphatase [Bacteroidota bacterium]